MKTRLTTEVFYDDTDPNNVGWAWRTDAASTLSPGGLSGQLDGHENEETLSRAEALAFAHEVAEFGDCTHVRVYWHGETDPIEFSVDELGQ